MKQNEEQPNLLPNLIKLMTQLVKQNSVLIKQSTVKEQFILQLIQQNDEILSELADQNQDDDNDDDEQPASTYLDG